MAGRAPEVRRAAPARLATALLYLLTCANGLQAVRIVKMDVPPIVQYGVQDSVVLDCDYVYNNTSGLVVKWFFKNNTRPVYQWIPPKKPQDMGILRGRVDLNYKVSEDPYTMHRAVRIIKPATDISGDYMCVVSTFLEEDKRTMKMVVFVPQTRFQLIQNKTDDDTVNVICAADGIFPTPNLTLWTPQKRIDGVSYEVRLSGGRFSATAMVTLRDAELPSPAEFICKLRIPAANYTVREEAIYYPGPMSTTPEMPTAADMQLAAAVGSNGIHLHFGIASLWLAIAHLLL